MYLARRGVEILEAGTLVVEVRNLTANIYSGRSPELAAAASRQMLLSDVRERVTCIWRCRALFGESEVKVRCSPYLSIPRSSVWNGGSEWT